MTDRVCQASVALGERWEGVIVPQLRYPRLNFADLFFVEPTCLVFAIARDEGDGIARIQQRDRSLDLGAR